MNELMHNAITAVRDREAGEIIPVRAEQSATRKNFEGRYGAGNAIDLDFGTRSWAVNGSDGTTWLKITLDNTHCVEQAIGYNKHGETVNTWTCTESGCECERELNLNCDSFKLTVSTEGAESDLSPVSDCRYGDTVKLEIDTTRLIVNEIAVIGKEGT